MSARVWERRRTAVLAAAAALSLVGSVALSSAPATAAPTTAPAASADTAPPPGGTYVPVTPSRILDTRSGLGAPKGATTGLTLTVDGRGGVPTTGVGAVVLNLTVTAPVSDGWLSVGPQSTTTSSNVNFLGGQDVAQLAVSQVATDGTVSLTANVRTQVVADVVGWFTDSDHTDAGGTFTPAASPLRAFDSRLAGNGGALRNGQARRITLPNRPADATAAMVNLTAVHPDHQSYLSAWPGGTWTGTSSMNIAPGDIRSNRAIVPIGDDGTISLVTNALTVDVVVDVNGWFGGTGGARFVPTVPARVFDEFPSAGGGMDNNPLDGYVVQVADEAGLPPVPSTVSLVSVWATTTVRPNRLTGWLAFTAYRAAMPHPPVVSSDLNFDAFDPTPNATLLPIGEGGNVRLSSTVSPVESPMWAHDVGLIVDVAGFFIAPPEASTPGLWEQGPAGAWNRSVTGTFSDVTAAAASGDQDAVLRRDGTVEEWWQGDAHPTAAVLDHGATALAGGDFGLFVLHPDGTVWADSVYQGAHGVPDGSGAVYGQVAGVADVTALAIGGDIAYALHADGTVTAWGTGIAPGPLNRALLGPVRTLAVDGTERRRCTVYRDGRVEIMDKDLPTSQLVPGLVAVDAVAAPGWNCVTADTGGNLTLVHLDSDGTVTTSALPGPPATKLVPTFVPVIEDGQSAAPTVRALGVDGVVRDWVGDHWVVQPGLNGATVLAGGRSMLSFVPGR